MSGLIEVIFYLDAVHCDADESLTGIWCTGFNGLNWDDTEQNNLGKKMPQYTMKKRY